MKNLIMLTLLFEKTPTWLEDCVTSKNEYAIFLN